MPDPYRWVKESLNTLHRANWYRQVQGIEGRAGPLVTLVGQPVINFASNDYLGLAADERLAQRVIAYVAGRRDLIDFSRNRAPIWIYTTGLSPADTAAALGVIALL